MDNQTTTAGDVRGSGEAAGRREGEEEGTLGEQVHPSTLDQMAPAAYRLTRAYDDDSSKH